MILVRAALFLKGRSLSDPQSSFELPIEISDNETPGVEQGRAGPMASLPSETGFDPARISRLAGRPDRDWVGNTRIAGLHSYSGLKSRTCGPFPGRPDSQA